MSRRYRLLPRSPAPARRTTAVASSTTTSLKPSRCQVLPEEPRSPSAMRERALDRAMPNDGGSEQSSVASSAIAAAQITTRALRPAPARNGIDAIICAGTSPMSTCISHCERAMPTILPAKTSTIPSVMNWRTNLPFDAPRALRTASSRPRLSERTSTRLATFTHPISRSSPAPPRAPAAPGEYRQR